MIKFKTAEAPMQAWAKAAKKAKKQKGDNPKENFPTPDLLAQGIVQYIGKRWGWPSLVIEPSAGNGAFVKAARAEWPKAHIIAVEIRQEEQENLLKAGADRVMMMPWEQACKDEMLRTLTPYHDVLVLGNPPFSLAQSHIELAIGLPNAAHRVSFLLRNGFLGSHKRTDFWAKGELEEMKPLVPRPSFEGGGNDNSEYSVFTFVKNPEPTTPTILSMPPLVWRPEK